jgi:glycosyltransferase involved in cell wall biosynthesis
MRVLMLTQFYPPVVGGQERHVRDLAHALARRGHEVEVATVATDGAPGAARDGEVVVHRLRSTTLRAPGIYTEADRPHAAPVPDPELRAGVGRLLAGRRFDVVHAHDWIVNSALGPARRRGVPVVLTQHDYSHVCATKRMMRADADGGASVCPGPGPVACVVCAARTYGRLMGPPVAAANLVGRRARRRYVAAFVPVSEAVAARTGLTGAVFEVIANFVPDDIVLDADALTPAADGPVVYVGDVTADKGVAVLFAAYRRLDDPPPLVLAGRVFHDSPSDVPPGVQLLGPQEPATVLALMRRARVVVVPSVVLDACPTVVLEAMAAGRPVVGSARGGIVSLVEDGVTGVLVAPEDPVALAGALALVIRDPARGADMGRNGLTRVRAFTASAVAERIEHLYRRVAAVTARAS